MAIQRFIAIALMCGSLLACHGRDSEPVIADGPYSEEADLWAICEQRLLDACELDDELCTLIEALPIDMELRCSLPSESAACVPAGALVDDRPLAAVCAADIAGNAWAISGELPPGWEPLSAAEADAWRENCDLVPLCKD